MKRKINEITIFSLLEFHCRKATDKMAAIAYHSSQWITLGMCNLELFKIFGRGKCSFLHVERPNSDACMTKFSFFFLFIIMSSLTMDSLFRTQMIKRDIVYRELVDRIKPLGGPNLALGPHFGHP